MNDEKLILHIARTSLAGAPIRLVKALNKYTPYKARLLDFIPLKMEDGEYKFPEDLVGTFRKIENKRKNL